MFFLNISDLETRGVIILFSRKKTLHHHRNGLEKYWQAYQCCLASPETLSKQRLCAAQKFYLLSSGEAPKA